MNKKDSFINWLIKGIAGIIIISFISYANQTPGGFLVASGTILTTLWYILSFLFDKFWWLILIGFVVLLLREKMYWFRDIEKTFRNYADELVDRIEEYEKSYLLKDMAKKAEEEYKRFIKTHKNYLHLKEQYRHNEKAKLIKKDWISYLKAIRAILDRKEILDTGAAPINTLEEHSYKEYKAKITMEEIEKRFKKLLEN